MCKVRAYELAFILYCRACFTQYLDIIVCGVIPAFRVMKDTIVQTFHTLIDFYFVLPAELCNLLTSHNLRIVPSGFVLSHRMSPW